MRLDYGKTSPAALHAMLGLEHVVGESTLEPELLDLVKLRASQLNGCAYCIQFHLNLARRLGVAPAKLDLVAAWRDAGIYCARERAALAWTEALTLMAAHHVPDAVYADLQAQFSATEIAFLTASVAAINAWNRIAGALQFVPLAPSK